ncbi:MAG TPA: type II toxin-antitoxin system RelE/ParE family toxin [Terriglobales bacterium]|nr:type II toxin-antitoxin system RelE/ParE family toxin [Terriglobales bacterium]
MAYTIQFKPAAARQFERLPRDAQQRIATKIDGLRDQPFPAGVKKLTGLSDAWRIRVGDYRIVYQVHRKMLLVLVLVIGHRREVYR